MLSRDALSIALDGDDNPDRQQSKQLEIEEDVGIHAVPWGLTSASAAPAGGRRLHPMVGPLVSYMFH
jgi:hypothetical protein